jgi:hypothetical protein
MTIALERRQSFHRGSRLHRPHWRAQLLYQISVPPVALFITDAFKLWQARRSAVLFSLGYFLLAETLVAYNTLCHDSHSVISSPLFFAAKVCIFHSYNYEFPLDAS